MVLPFLLSIKLNRVNRVFIVFTTYEGKKYQRELKTK